MRSRSILLVLLVLFAASMNSGKLFGQSGSSVQKKGITGQQAPEWAVSTWHQLPEGKSKLNVGDFKGKVLYLYFFQSWCPGCHSQGFPTLKSLHGKYKDDKEVGFAVIQTTFEGHRVNTASKLKSTAAKYKLPIPFGQSAGDSGTPEIMRKYRSGGTPWVVVVDKSGKIQYNDFHVSPEKASKLIERLKKK